MCGSEASQLKEEKQKNHKLKFNQKLSKAIY